MTDIYNMTSVDEAQNILQYYASVDILTGGWLSIFLLATLNLILLVTYRRTDTDFKSSVVVSSTITSVIALLLFWSNVVTWKGLIFPICLLCMGIILYILSE